MRVEVCIPETWTDVSMGWRDIMQQLDIREHADDVKRLANEYYCMMDSIPDDDISALEPSVRKIIADALHRQAARFEAIESDSP